MIVGGFLLVMVWVFDKVLKLGWLGVGWVYRVSQKKRNIRVLCIFCLISPATINLQSCGIRVGQKKAKINYSFFAVANVVV